MKRFMFVIDGRGIVNCNPIDCKLGENKEFGGAFLGAEFHKIRAALNWDRGCYYIETDLLDCQLEFLKEVLIDSKDCITGKVYIETITGKNFETETGYKNPFDPEWKLSFDLGWYLKRKLWLKRAGLDFVEPDCRLFLDNFLMIKEESGRVSNRIVLDGVERSFASYKFRHFLTKPRLKSTNPTMTIDYDYLKELVRKFG
jgi:hypothetical protein